MKLTQVVKTDLRTTRFLVLTPNSFVWKVSVMVRLLRTSGAVTATALSSGSSVFIRFLSDSPVGLNSTFASKVPQVLIMVAYVVSKALSGWVNRQLSVLRIVGLENVTKNVLTINVTMTDKKATLVALSSVACR